MSNLIPEQRLDKNGRLNTKHVRATPKSLSDPSSVPAPSLGIANTVSKSKAATKAFKPRVSQTKITRHTLNELSDDYHLALAELNKTGYRWGQGALAFSFEANEVDTYAVLSVTSPANAARLLSHGIKTADEAVSYLREHGAEDAIIDAREVTDDALRRGIKSEIFMTRGPLLLQEGSPYVMDAMELRSIAAVADQVGGRVELAVLSGDISLAEIKHLGVSNLKSHKRLRRSVDAIINARDPEFPYSLDDLKTLVERASSEGTSTIEGEYYCALEHLMQGGPEAINDCHSLAFFRLIDSSHRSFPMEERISRIKYEAKLYSLHNDRSYHNKERSELAMRMRDAGVSAEDAGRMLHEGMSERAILAVVNELAEKPLAEGWL